MVDIFLVVGDAKAGKSATISALTGAARQKTSWPIEIGNPASVQDFFVAVRSLQEGNNAYSPAAFVQKINSLGVSHVIAALRLNGIGPYPNAQTYIDYFEGTAGWNVVGTCEIPTAALVFAGSPIRVSVLPRPSTTANQRGKILRGRWRIS